MPLEIKVRNTFRDQGYNINVVSQIGELLEEIILPSGEESTTYNLEAGDSVEVSVTFSAPLNRNHFYVSNLISISQYTTFSANGDTIAPGFNPMANYPRQGFEGYKDMTTSDPQFLLTVVGPAAGTGLPPFDEVDPNVVVGDDDQ